MQGGGYPRVVDEPPQDLETAIYDFTYVILGGGTVAGYAAREFVIQHGGRLPEGHLCIITEEGVCPYERPALSKGLLLGKDALPGFEACAAQNDIKDQSWYNENNISVLMGARVTRIEFFSKCLLLDKLSIYVRYKKLLLGTGALCAELIGAAGSSLSGIHYMRSLWETQNLLLDLETFNSSQIKTVVVGGGYIAMECASALIARGCHQVTIAHRAPHLLRRLFTPEIAAMYEAFMTGRGIRLIPNTHVSSFIGDETGRVQGVLLQSGEDLEAQLVIVGVGAVVDNSLFQELEMLDGWVKVDSFMRTSAPDVYAAGDLISCPIHRYQRRSGMNEKTVTHARRSAEHAVRHMVGMLLDPYELIPYSYSRVFNLSWHFFGDARGKCFLIADKSIDPSEAKTLRFVAVWIGDDRRACGIMVEGCSAEEKQCAENACTTQPLMDLQAIKEASDNGHVEYVFEMLDDVWIDTMKLSIEQRASMVGLSGLARSQQVAKLVKGSVVDKFRKKDKPQKDQGHKDEKL